MAGVVLVEICLRVFFPAPMSISYSDEQLLSVGLDPSIYFSDEHGVSLRADRKMIILDHPTNHRRISFRTNSLGLRSDEPRDDATPRILFLGDSITMGSYIEEDETFVSKTRVSADSYGKKIQTFNGGIAGTGLSNYVMILDKMLPVLKPDMVVLDLYLNDFQREVTLRIFNPPRQLRWSWLASYLVDALSVLYDIFRHNRMFSSDISTDPLIWNSEVQKNLQASSTSESFSEKVVQSIDDWGGAWSNEAWVMIEEQLSKINEKCLLAGVPLLIVLFPAASQVADSGSSDFPQQKAALLAEKFHRPFVDLLPYLKKSSTKDTAPLFYDHCHPTPHGNEVIAGVLTPFILQNLLEKKESRP